jgi:signal transduction histidine kinase
MLIRVAAKALQNAWLFEQVRSGRERLKFLSHRLVKVQEGERHYIARELHDEAGQGLALLLIRLRLLENDVDHPESVISGIHELKRILNDVSEGLHRLAVRLRPVSLDHFGIVPALRQHIEDIGNLHNIKAQFESIDVNGRLPLEVETSIYRIVQEGLTNIVRHGQATRVDILLQNRGHKLVVIIEDNGIGFKPDTTDKSKHLGLVGIAERAEMLNGTMTIESTPGVGTTLLVEVPYEQPHTDS